MVILQRCGWLLVAWSLTGCSFPAAGPTPIYPLATAAADGTTATPFLPLPATALGHDGSQESPTALPTASPASVTPAPTTPTIVQPSDLPGEPTSAPRSAATLETPQAVTASPTLPASTADAELRRSVLLPIAEAIISRVNHDRALLGVPPLIAPPSLMEIAFLRAEDLAARAYLDSLGPGESNAAAWRLLVAAGYGGAMAENLFASTESVGQLADAAMAAWMGSPAHRQVILDPRYRYIGVGLMGDGTWWKVSQVFAERGP